MPTDLSPAEKEDRESERLLDHSPAPSRKHRERRAPRPWQRRRRLREDDPDTHKQRESKSLSDWEDQSDAEIRELDDILKGLGPDDAGDDDVDPEDFDDAIGKLTGDLPPKARQKKLEEMAEKMSDGGYDRLADFLRGSVGDLDSLRDLGPPADVSPSSLEEIAGRMSDGGYDRLAEILRGSVGDLGSLKPAEKSATSNDSPSGMSPRTGAYHGVVDVRGNPTDPPNTGWKSTDKRYFTNKDYDAIVKFASDLLKKDDWLKYGWDGGAEDAPMRAALDQAIQTASGAVYQSKIDSETYSLLLNRLAKWGHDTFSDTDISGKAPSRGTRSSSKMNKNSEEYRNIVRVASDLRATDPVASLNIIKNLRALVSSEMEPSEEISEHVAADVAASSAPPATSIRSASVEVPFSLLARLAASNPEVKAAVGPLLLAAKKKDDKKDDKTAKGKVPPQFLKNMKKGPPKAKGKGKKKKASISADDLAW